MSVTIASFNICSSHFLHGKFTRENLERLGAVISDCGADVVSLQEVDRGCARSDRVDMTSELSTLGGYPYSYFIKIRDFQGGEYGTAILSGLPIIHAETLNFNVKIAKQGTSCGYVVLDSQYGHITLFNTHLSVESEEANTETMQCLRDILLSHGGEILCTGDFNTNPDKLNKYIPELETANKNLFTYADRSIDNLMYTDGYEVLSVNTIDTTKSNVTDHNMLICTVSIKKEHL